MRELNQKSEIRNQKSEIRPMSGNCRPKDTNSCLLVSIRGFRSPSFWFWLGQAGISGFGLLCVFVFVAWPHPLRAATNLISSDDIPPLRPARPELPPTFWERYGVWVVIAGFVLLLLLAIGIWYLTRPKPPVIVPPAVKARQALQALEHRPEDGLVLSRVSQILRHYVTAAFELTAGELTTTEFCLQLLQLDRMGPAISVPLTDFFRQCDQRKFAPNAPPQPLGVVDRASRFIDQCEARLVQLRQSALTGQHDG